MSNRRNRQKENEKKKMRKQTEDSGSKNVTTLGVPILYVVNGRQRINLCDVRTHNKVSRSSRYFLSSSLKSCTLDQLKLICDIHEQEKNQKDSGSLFQINFMKSFKIV